MKYFKKLGSFCDLKDDDVNVIKMSLKTQLTVCEEYLKTISDNDEISYVIHKKEVIQNLLNDLN